MYQIALGDEMEAVVISGPGAEAPFRGAAYRPGGGMGETVEDRLEVSIEASDPADLGAAKVRLGRWLGRLQVEGQAQDRPQVFLWVTPSAGEPAWRSPLVSGWLEPLDSRPESGATAVRLRLTRRNYWEGEPAAVPLSNALVSRTTGELSVTNHADEGLGHENAVEIAGEDVSGDLPAPACLTLRNLSPAPAGQILIAALQHSARGGFFPHAWEAENAQGGETQADGSCSGGARRSLAWSGAADTRLLTWSIQMDALAQAGGRLYRAVLRLAPAPAYPDLWLRFKLEAGPTPLWESAWRLAEAGHELFDGGAVPLPPGVFQEAAWGAVGLALYGRRSSGEAAALSVDALTLLPLDGWRRLASRGNGLPQHRALVDDGPRDAVYLLDGGEEAGDFAATGEPIGLAPGERQRLIFLQTSLSGASAPIDQTLNVRLSYRPRRRFL